MDWLGQVPVDDDTTMHLARKTRQDRADQRRAARFARPRSLRLVTEGAPARGRLARSTVVRPAGDALVAAVAAFFIADPLHVALYAAVAPLAIGATGAYIAPSFGASARLRTAMRLCLGAMVAGWVHAVLAGTGGGAITLGELGPLWLASVGGWMVLRAGLRLYERRHPERVVVLGSGQIAARLETLAERFGEGRFELIGFIDDEPSVGRAGDLAWLGDRRDLHHLLEVHAVERVMVAFSASPDARTAQMIRDCDSHGVRVDVVPRLFEFVATHSGTYSLGGMPLVSIAPRLPRPLQRLAKRTLDVVAAGLLLAITAPVQVVVALLISLEDRGPVVYRQLRVGKDGKPFRIFKFRSMSVAAEEFDRAQIDALRDGSASIEAVVRGIKLDPDARVTRIGRFIRRTSLDELPQLLNVLRGEMSMVGPRPLRPFEVEMLEPWERTRMLERPGLTGLWQVTGRSEAEWSERMQLDYSYVRHWSLGQDLEILARTVRAVLRGDGAR